MSSGAVDQGNEVPCPSCGAMVRRGLVRCWHCSAFMRPEIAAAYERMQEEQPDVGFRPLPEHVEESRAPAKKSAPDDEGGFELGASFSAALPEDRKGRAASAFTGKNLHRDAAAENKSANGTPPQTAKDSEQSGKSAASESPTKDKEDAEARRKALRGDSADVAHSEATGGDLLLQTALQEERELGSRRRTAFNPVCVAGGWMITCPCPAHVRIKVREAHRGKTGKCPNPNCGSYFTVPENLPEPEKAADTDGPVETGFPADPAEKAGPYTHWLRDVRLHVVKPAKAKRKSGGHEKDFQLADIGFSQEEGLAVISLASKAAGFLGKPKKPEQLREELLTELRAETPAAEISSQAVFSFAADVLAKMIVEYPPAYEHESTFAGVPVFGAGFIAVKLPPAGADDEQHFISLTLTQYRRLRELLAGLFDEESLGFSCPIPTDDDVVQLECHYSENKLTVLRDPTFHLADPEIELETVAYRCASCGLIVSEESRKKEKIGGLEGKKLASAKCPKCKGKFGNNPLYGLKTPATDEAVGTDEVAGEQKSAEAASSE